MTPIWHSRQAKIKCSKHLKDDKYYLYPGLLSTTLHRRILKCVKLFVPATNFAHLHVRSVLTQRRPDRAYLFLLLFLFNMSSDPTMSGREHLGVCMRLRVSLSENTEARQSHMTPGDLKHPGIMHYNTVITHCKTHREHVWPIYNVL